MIPTAKNLPNREGFTRADEKKPAKFVIFPATASLADLVTFHCLTDRFPKLSDSLTYVGRLPRRRLTHAAKCSWQCVYKALPPCKPERMFIRQRAHSNIQISEQSAKRKTGDEISAVTFRRVGRCRPEQVARVGDWHSLHVRSHPTGQGLGLHDQRTRFVAFLLRLITTNTDRLAGRYRVRRRECVLPRHHLDHGRDSCD